MNKNDLKLLNRKENTKIIKDDIKEADKIKTLSITMYNSAVYNLNFAWLYLLEIFSETKSYEDISNIINKILPDMINIKSISELYVYLLKAFEDDGYLDLDTVKERIPSYKKSLNDDKVKEYIKEYNEAY